MRSIISRRRVRIEASHLYIDRVKFLNPLLMRISINRHVNSILLAYLLRLRQMNVLDVRMVGYTKVKNRPYKGSRISNSKSRYYKTFEVRLGERIQSEGDERVLNDLLINDAEEV